MKNKLEVGMYVRDRYGDIYKNYGESENFFEEIIFVDKEHGLYNSIKKSNITKASYNIIDLIEEGDYVNGWLVYEVQITENDTERTFVSVDECYDNYCGFIYNNEIKEILTKEQYEANIYRVVE